MKRTWKDVALIGATAQPAFGTYLTSALTLVLDFQGKAAKTQQLLVADASQFILQDLVLVVETDGTSVDNGRIVGISGNMLTVEGLRFAHAANAWVILNQNCASVYIQRGETQSGSMGIGNKVTSSLTGRTNVIMVLHTVPTGQPYEFSDAAVYGANPASTSEFWVVGTQGDDYLPSYSYI